MIEEEDEIDKEEAIELPDGKTLGEVMEELTSATPKTPIRIKTSSSPTPLEKEEEKKTPIINNLVDQWSSIVKELNAATKMLHQDLKEHKLTTPEIVGKDKPQIAPMYRYINDEGLLQINFIGCFINNTPVSITISGTKPSGKVIPIINPEIVRIAVACVMAWGHEPGRSAVSQGTFSINEDGNLLMKWSAEGIGEQSTVILNPDLLL